jgi:hypothetical protein
LRDDDDAVDHRCCDGLVTEGLTQRPKGLFEVMRATKKTRGSILPLVGVSLMCSAGRVG